MQGHKKKRELIMRVKFQNARDMVEMAEKLRFYGYDVSLVEYDYTKTEELTDDIYKLDS